MYVYRSYIWKILLLTDAYAIRGYSKTKDEKKSERGRRRRGCHRSRRDYTAMAYNDGEKDRVYTMFARLRKASEFQEFTRRKSRVFGWKCMTKNNKKNVNTRPKQMDFYTWEKRTRIAGGWNWSMPTHRRPFQLFVVPSICLWFNVYLCIIAVMVVVARAYVVNREIWSETVCRSVSGNACRWWDRVYVFRFLDFVIIFGQRSVVGIYTRDRGIVWTR